MRSDYNPFAHDFSQTRQQAWPEFLLLKPCLGKHDRVLDIGCGNARLRSFLDEKLIPVGNYFGFDLSHDLLGLARKKHPLDHFFQGDFSKKLPFGSDNFDIITGIASFHHLLTSQEQHDCLQEMNRVLKPGGRIFLTTWKIPSKHLFSNLQRTDFWKSGFKNYLVPFGVNKYPRYYRLVTGSNLKNLLLQNGFSVEQVTLERNRNWVIIGTKK